MPEANPPAQPAPAKPPSTATLEFRRALAKLAEPLPKPKSTWGFRFAQAVVAVFMLLLPLCYLAVVAALGYGLYRYALGYAHLLAWPEEYTVGSARIFVFYMFGRWLLYFAPLLGGAFLLLALVKPFFARRGKDMNFLLQPSAAPAFVKFVHAIADAAGASRPAEIRLVCFCNAAVGPTGGLVSLVRGRLTLSVGMPLLAILDARELAGVLAHEFGHFNQRGAMVPRHIVDRVNDLFGRAVYGRDRWDEVLWAFSQEENVLGLLAMSVRAVVGVGRLCMMPFVWTALAASAGLARHMERDADEYELRVAGSDAFIDRMRKNVFGALAENITDRFLMKTMTGNRLPANYVELFEAVYQAIPEAKRDAIAEEMAQGETGLFDSHPCVRERCDRARAARDPGRVDANLRSRALFVDWPAMSKAVSAALYRAMLGDRGLSWARVPTAELRPDIEKIAGSVPDTPRRGA